MFNPFKSSHTNQANSRHLLTIGQHLETAKSPDEFDQRGADRREPAKSSLAKRALAVGAVGMAAAGVGYAAQQGATQIAGHQERTQPAPDSFTSQAAGEGALTYQDGNGEQQKVKVLMPENQAGPVNTGIDQHGHIEATK